MWKIQIQRFDCKVQLFEFPVLLIIRKRKRREGEREKGRERERRRGKEGKREEGRGS